MSKTSNIRDMSSDEFIKIVSMFSTKRDIYNHFGIPENGTSSRLIKTKIDETGAKLKPRNRFKYKVITKECPVCGKSFTAQLNHPREKTTCSYACANTFFRSGINNGSHQKAIKKYSENELPSRTIQTKCFDTHDYKCCICSENRIVHVHHFDENHNNNDILNLIPLCPTCHQLFHTKQYRDVIYEGIILYRANFIETSNTK
jgi:hypothetical protein